MDFQSFGFCENQGDKKRSIPKPKLFSFDR